MGRASAAFHPGKGWEKAAKGRAWGRGSRGSYLPVPSVPPRCQPSQRRRVRAEPPADYRACSGPNPDGAGIKREPRPAPRATAPNLSAQPGQRQCEPLGRPVARGRRTHSRPRWPHRHRARPPPAPPAPSADGRGWLSLPDPTPRSEGSEWLGSGCCPEGQEGRILALCPSAGQPVGGKRGRAGPFKLSNSH